MKVPGGKKPNKRRALWLADSPHDPLDQGYAAKLNKLPIEPGKVYEVQISHDDWCPLLKGGPCRCDPDVKQVEIDTTQDNTAL